jgi:pimeloyl-ACP methyl ester carboxylesterase
MSKPSKHSVISVTSADGTVIGADAIGEGSPLIMLGGAFNTRQATEPLAVALQSDFRILNPDAAAGAYESMVIGDLRIPPDLLQKVVVPTLVIVGEESAPVLRSAGEVVAEGLPRGRLSILSGQGHDIAPDVTAEVMRRFLTEEE